MSSGGEGASDDTGGATSSGGTSDSGGEAGGENGGTESTGGTENAGGADGGSNSAGGTESAGGNAGAGGNGGTSGAAGNGGMSGSGGNGGSGPCVSATPQLGCSCSSNGALACNGPSQKLKLVCQSGVWKENGTCSSSQNCAQSDGACHTIVSGCAGKSVGFKFCEGVDVLRECGADLVSASSSTCSGTCSAGACQAPRCGDQKVQANLGEECDDGNDVPADGCEPQTCKKSRVVSLALGASHTCALLSGGNVRCWGKNDLGQLGLGHAEFVGDKHPYQITNTAGLVRPVDLGGKATAIAAGLDHTCALLEDQTIRCWGANDFGQLGLGNNNAQVDKTPNALGPINVGGNAKAISAGGKVSCAVLTNGNVRCWGRNLLGSLGLGHTTPVSNTQRPNQFGPISLGTTATAVSTGSSHSCALLTGGSVRCWGFNTNGELGIQSTTHIGDDEVPSTASTVALPSGRTAVALAVGVSHTCARLDNGDLECWGFNSSGQLGMGHTSHIGDGESPAAWGIPPTTAFDALDLDTGDHTCALFSGGGGLRCWGNNSSAQLGLADVNPRGHSNATTPDLLTPIAFGGGRSAKGIFTGVAHTCALLDNDSVRCWGSNQAGQLGLGFVSGAIIGSLPYVGGDANSTPDKLANIKVVTSAD